MFNSTHELLESQETRFDEQAVPNAQLNDLDPALWQRFANPQSQDHRDVLLTKLTMATQNADGCLRPTVAGVLMAIPNTMTVDSMPYRQAARNEAITSLLAKCPVTAKANDVPMTLRSTMMDKRGEGVPLVLRLTQNLAGKLPVYTLVDESELLLTIPAAGDLLGA